MTHDLLDGMEYPALLADYEQYGVVRVRHFFSSTQIEDIRAAVGRYIANVVPKLPQADCTFEADGVSVRNLWRLEKHDEYFRRLGQQRSILDLVEKLVNGEPILVGVETFNKPALTGSAVPWHQDNAYFCQTPPDMLTIWIAVDPATVENGAVYYAPGTQDALLPHAPSGVAGNSMGVAEPPEVPQAKQFCGELDSGDALIHHCQVLHRSEPNTSPRSRLGLLMVFRGSHTRDDSRLKTAYEKALNNA